MEMDVKPLRDQARKGARKSSKSASPEAITAGAQQASRCLKALAHANRLLALCFLVDGEKTVGELETLLGIRQAAASQLLARLRHDGLVSTRREGRHVFYALASEEAHQIVKLLYELYCDRRDGTAS